MLLSMTPGRGLQPAGACVTLAGRPGVGRYDPRVRVRLATCAPACNRRTKESTMLRPWLLTLTAGALGAAAAVQAAPAYFPHAVAPEAQPLPFSDAVRVGDTLYVAGHLGT